MLTQTKCQTKRVNRNFPINIAQKLETIQIPDLAFLLDQIPKTQEKQCKLPEWQIQGIKEAQRSLAKGHSIPYKEVKKWMESWGTKNELPMPKCK